MYTVSSILPIMIDIITGRWLTLWNANSVCVIPFTVTITPSSTIPLRAFGASSGFVTTTTDWNKITILIKIILPLTLTTIRATQNHTTIILLPLTKTMLLKKWVKKKKGKLIAHVEL